MSTSEITRGQNVADYLGGSSSAEAVSALKGIADTGVAIADFVERKRKNVQDQKNFDRTFEENMRRFGLEFALQEWAARKNVALTEAQMLYQREFSQKQQGMDRMALSASLTGQAQQRLQGAEEFAWMREDRAKQQEMQRRYSRGIIQGLTGRKL